MDDNTIDNLKKFITFFEINLELIIHYKHKGRTWLKIDFYELTKFDPDLADLLLEKPEDTLELAQKALKTVEPDYEMIIRFFNISQTQERSPWEIRGEDITKFISLKGILNKISPITHICTKIKFECPSCGKIIELEQEGEEIKEPHMCLPKGTLVYTPSGLKPIEKANEVLCVDHYFNLTSRKSKIIHTGKKEVWTINNKIKCSGNHQWFVFRSGTLMVVQTKDLYIGDTLYQINDNLCDMWKGVYSKDNLCKKWNKNLSKKDNINQADMFKGMCKKSQKQIFNWHRTYNIKHKRSDKTISRREEIMCSNCKTIRWNHPPINSKKIIERGNNIKEHLRTIKNKFEWKNQSKRNRTLQLQTRKPNWTKRCAKNSKEALSLEMYNVWCSEEWNEGLSSAPQKSKSSGQQIRKFDGYLQPVPCKITQLSKTDESVDMYDLQVPDYHNFILEDGIITHNCGCGRRGKFKILNQEFIDVIRLGIIDDLMEEKNKSIGIAKEKIVLLSKDLTHQLIDKELKVGKKVRINGFFKYTQKKTRAGAGSLEFASVFIANSIEFIKVGWDIVKIEESDKEEIVKLSQDKLILDRLANCIADVEGHDIIKKACILLLTGAPHIYDSNFHLNSRGTIHMLMIGDPGTGKTYMAKRAGGISPINYFQSAANASGKGLVASVNQDKELGIWVAYPGVVPMANQGVVIIDEIDKTSEEDYGDHNNAMNDMEVFIAKSNVKAKLTTETSYLATANPANRVFTDHELFYNQIDMPKDFMDRFDLIFPMVSPTDADKKDKIMDSILDRYIDNKDVDKKWKPEFTHEFITKYISYCRREKPLPTLSKDFLPYIKKRLHTLMKPKGEDQIKVSFRQLESILRFAYASARLHLRDVAQADIDFAFELKYSSFLGLHIINESGDFDWAKLENIEIQKISDKNKVIDILKEMLSDSEKVVDVQEIMAKCINSGIKDESLVEEIIEKKKQAGDYYEPRRGFLRRI